jgi:hypothetical protein
MTTSKGFPKFRPILFLSTLSKMRVATTHDTFSWWFQTYLKEASGE